VWAGAAGGAAPAGAAPKLSSDETTSCDSRGSTRWERRWI